MDQKQVKEILGKQLQLLAEVSKKTSKPEDLPELTKAMVLLAQNLRFHSDGEAFLCRNHKSVLQQIRWRFRWDQVQSKSFHFSV